MHPILFYAIVDGFLNLSDEVGETVESPEFMLCSRLWQLRIFPGGELSLLYFVYCLQYVCFYIYPFLTCLQEAYKLIKVTYPSILPQRALSLHVQATN